MTGACMRYALYQALVIVGVIWAVDTLALNGRYGEAVWRQAEAIGQSLNAW
jgi:hypothetical protein